MAKITLNDINKATVTPDKFIDIFDNGGQQEKRKKKLRVDINELEPNELNGFYVADDEDLEALAEVINDDGMSNPIRVKEKGENGKYTILSGHRRWKAAKKAGIQQVDVVVVPNDFSLSEEIAYITRENAGGRGDDPFGRAYMVQMYLEEQEKIHPIKRVSVGDALRLKKATLSRLLKLAKLPVDILKAGQNGYITQNDALLLADNLLEHKIIGNGQLNEIRDVIKQEKEVAKKQIEIKNILTRKPVRERGTQKPDEFKKLFTSVEKIKKLSEDEIKAHAEEIQKLKDTLEELLNTIN